MDHSLPTLFDLDPTIEVCRFPDHAATTGYIRGCRCGRCRQGQRDVVDRAKAGLCNVEGCDNRRMKGRGYCIEHVPLARQAKRRTKSEATCEICKRTHSWYESVLETNIRPDSHDLYRRTCAECRNRYMRTISGHRLNTDWAIRLLTATHCELCNDRFSTDKQKRRQSVIDHDHQCCGSGRTCGRCVRGIICHPCNVRVGAIEGAIDAGTLDVMLAYIQTRSAARG